MTSKQIYLLGVRKTYIPSLRGIRKLRLLQYLQVLSVSLSASVMNRLTRGTNYGMNMRSDGSRIHQRINASSLDHCTIHAPKAIYASQEDQRERHQESYERGHFRGKQRNRVSKDIRGEPVTAVGDIEPSCDPESVTKFLSYLGAHSRIPRPPADQNKTLSEERLFRNRDVRGLSRILLEFFECFGKSKERSDRATDKLAF